MGQRSGNAAAMMVDKNASARLADDGEHVEFWHVCTFDRKVMALLPVNTASGWTVANKDPLTLNPSVQCLACDWHGWILKGECVK